jgi:hypothetical protein
MGIVDYVDDGRRDPPALKSDRWTNAVIMAGMSYGFYRVAAYNLWQADGDDHDQRSTGISSK